MGVPRFLLAYYLNVNGLDSQLRFCSGCITRQCHKFLSSTPQQVACNTQEPCHLNTHPGASLPCYKLLGVELGSRTKQFDMNSQEKLKFLHSVKNQSDVFHNIWSALAESTTRKASLSRSDRQKFVTTAMQPSISMRVQQALHSTPCCCHTVHTCCAAMVNDLHSQIN